MEPLPDPSLSEDEVRSQAKRTKLAAAFGQSTTGSAGGMDAAALEKILKAGSAHADLVHESESSVAAQEALFNLMERKEGMAVQLNAITQQSVKAYRCLESGCTHGGVSEFPLQHCKLKGHRYEKVEVQKRFFTCHQCKFHISTLHAKMPTHACHKCGGTTWSKASMRTMVSTQGAHAGDTERRRKEGGRWRDAARLLWSFAHSFFFLFCL